MSGPSLGHATLHSELESHSASSFSLCTSQFIFSSRFLAWRAQIIVSARLSDLLLEPCPRHHPDPTPSSSETTELTDMLCTWLCLLASTASQIRSKARCNSSSPAWHWKPDCARPARTDLTVSALPTDCVEHVRWRVFLERNMSICVFAASCSAAALPLVLEPSVHELVL